jgi:hypothetical protein
MVSIFTFVEAHQGNQSEILGIHDESFSAELLEVGNDLTVTGYLSNLIEKPVKASLSLAIVYTNDTEDCDRYTDCIWSELTNSSNMWQISEIYPPEKIIYIPSDEQVHYSISSKALETGLYHIHTRINIEGIGSFLGPGQLIEVYSTNSQHQSSYTDDSNDNDYNNNVSNIDNKDKEDSLTYVNSVNQKSNNSISEDNLISSSEFLTYENTTNGISIDYPSDWTINPVINPQISPESALFSFISPMNSSFFCISTITIEPFPFQITLEGLVNHSINILKTSTPNFKLVENPTRSTLAGQDAYRIVYTATKEYGDLQSIVFITLIGNKSYIVGYACPESHYNISLQIAQKMIDSFKIMNVNNVSDITTDFLTYENTTNGISIDYPSDWTFDNENNLLSQFDVNLSGVDVFHFISPLNSSLISVINEPLEYYDYLPSLEEYIDYYINNHETSTPNFKLVENPTRSTLAGQDAYRIMYTATSGYQEFKFMAFVTINGDKGYIMLYSSTDNFYDLFLPIVQKMIDSFKIMGNFLTYENTTNGISIDYPLNWTINPTPLSSLDLDQEYLQYIKSVSFVSPIGQSVIITVEPWSNPKKYVNEFIKDANQIYPNFQLIENIIPSTLAGGHDAYRIVYKFSSGNLEFKSMDFVTRIGENLYRIIYMSPIDQFNLFLPIAQKMIDSFSLPIAKCEICND